MYGVTGEKATGRRKIDRFFTKSRIHDDPTLRCFKILPLVSSYIIIPPGGIIMYGLAGGTILK